MLVSQSEQVDQIADALSKALADYETAQKSGINSHLRAKYATLQDVCESLQGPLSKHGLSPVTVQPVCLSIGENQAQWVAVGVLRHKSGQWISGNLPLLTPKADMQGMVAALTYAKRALTLSLTGAWTGEVDDDGNSTRRDAPVAAAKTTAALTNGMAIESKATDMIRNGTESEAKRALSLVELRIAEGKATKAVLARCKKLFDERFAVEVVNG